MAVTTTESQTAYTGNGSKTTPYPIPWEFLDAAHIRVSVRLMPDGAMTPLPEGAYTVLMSGGNPRVTTAKAWGPEYQVFIWRDTPRLQPTVYPTNGRFPSKSHETVADRLTMIAQEQARDAGITGPPQPSTDYLPVIRGGTGAGAHFGYLKGNGTDPIESAPTIPPQDLLPIWRGDWLAEEEYPQGVIVRKDGKLYWSTTQNFDHDPEAEGANPWELMIEGVS